MKQFASWRSGVLHEHMTVANEEFQRRVDQTPIGMFSWAGSGPADHHCFSCAYFDRVEKPRKPELPHRCNKWAAWYRGAHGTMCAPKLPIPPQSSACSGYLPRGI